VFCSISNRRQVSELDVIHAHRLLESSDTDVDYPSLSDAAYPGIGRGLGLELHSGQASYENLGMVQVHVDQLTDFVGQLRDIPHALEPKQGKAAIRAKMSEGNPSFMPAAWAQLTRPPSSASWPRSVWFIVCWILVLPVLKLRDAHRRRPLNAVELTRLTSRVLAG
jgi:hypothetical protein